MDKSYVTMVTNFCPICGKEWNTGELLLDRRLSKRFERTTCTAVGLCEEHKAQVDSGEWVALIEASQVIDNSKGTIQYDPTGNGALLKKEAAVQLLGDTVAPFNYVEVGVLEQLQGMVASE